MDVIMRLYRLGLLPATVAALEGEESQAAATRLPRLAASRSAAAAPSLLSRAFLRWSPPYHRKSYTQRQRAGEWVDVCWGTAI